MTSSKNTPKHTFFAKLTNLNRKQKIFIIAVTVLAILIGVGLFFMLRITSSVGKTFQGNSFQALTSHEPLQQDDKGRTNILIFGNSSDDPGHGGRLLTDSMMILSYDHQSKKTYAISVPRDFWIEYGQDCVNGQAGKINALYQCNIRYYGSELRAGEELTKQVGTIFDLDIPYFAKVNYGFVRDAVNALGGIDVTIASDDPRGILDRTFDKNCPNGPNTCFNVKYENGVHHIDGEHALYLSRARNAKGGYGLPESNFDREFNQQMIVEAMQQKALSSGTLANPFKVTNFIQSLGNNITTNIPTSQVQSAVDALKAMDGNNSLVTIPLNDKNMPLVTTGTQQSQSIVLPTAGLYEYGQLRSSLQQALAQ